MSSRPRVLIDGRMVREIPHGIARYVRLIAKGLAELERLSYEPIFFCAPGMSSAFSGFETIELRTPFLDSTEMLSLPIQLWKSKAKLYHSPSFSSLMAAPCPWVVTIHDLNHLTYGGPLERVYYETMLRRFSEKASAVLTVSEFSKREIQNWNPKLRPEVVVNAVDPQFLKDVPGMEKTLARLELKKGNYFVCFANEKPHKNLSTLVRAFQEFRERSEDGKRFSLVVSTNRYVGEPGVRSFSGLNDPDAQAVLRGAAALASPSVYEGFGLPPVEAAVIGLPVMVSDISAHREALRDLGSTEVVWVPPLSEKGWADAFSAVASGRFKSISTASREKLIQRYAVQKLGQAMDRVYRRVLEIKT